MDFPKHIRDCMLYLVMANRLGLVAEVSEVYFAPGADIQMLSMKLCAVDQLLAMTLWSL